MGDSRTRPSREVEDIVLNAWVDGRNRTTIICCVAEATGQHLTNGQLSAIIARARKVNDPRAVKRNQNAVYVRAS